MDDLHTTTLLERSRTATVADAMTQGVVSCAPETPLRAVATLMAERRIHAVYVFDYGVEDDETVLLWGLVSDLDVVAASTRDVDRLRARDSAVAPLVTIESSETLAAAAALIAETGASHLAVVDPVTARPVGVLSTFDVVRHVARGGGGS